MWTGQQQGPHLMEVICFTTSAGECRSIRRLWMRISNLQGTVYA